MSAQNIIELGFNIEELTAEKKQVLDLFVDLFGKLQEYDGTKFNPLGNGGLGDLKKSLTDGAQAMAAFTQTAQKYNEVITQQAQKQSAGAKTTSDLGAAMKEYQRIINQLATAQAKNNAASSDAAEGLAAERAALRQRNAELAASAKLQMAEEGSINEAKAAVAQLTTQRNKENTATEEGRAKIAELNAEIDKNNEVIRQNSAALEQRKINIGNYAESLSPAFTALQEQLEGINEQIAAIETKGKSAFQDLTRSPVGFDVNRNKSSSNITGFLSGSAGSSTPILNADAAAYQKLTLQQKILEQSLERQRVGFSNANQEMRAVKNTLDALTLAGAKDTEVFEKLNVAYTSSEQKVKDLHREQAILESDAPALTALTGVARGLGGAYALGAGASQLFADGNEKVEKELNKLVAIMTFLQGLQEAVSVLKERNAIVTALEAEATKALTFIKGVEARLFGASAAAEVADTVAKEVNAAATVESAEATTANTVALEEETGATVSATAASGGLRTALVGAGVVGIAGAAIAVGVALALLTAKLIGYGEQAGITIQQQKDILEATKELNDALEGQAKVYYDLDDSQKRYYTNLLANASAAGASQYAILLAQQRSDQAQADAAKEDIDRLGATDAAYSRAANAVQRLRNEQAGYAEIIKELSSIPEKDLSKAQKEQIKAAQDNLQINKTQLDIAQKTFDNMRSAREKFQDFTQKAAEDDTRFTKLSLDDQLANTEKAEELRANLIKAKNELILADDKSTLDQRLAAMKSNATQEQAIINAQAEHTRNNPSNYVNGLLTPQAQRQIEEGEEKRKEILLKSQNDQQQLIIQYGDKRLGFLNDISKNELEGDAAIQKAISDNDTKQLDVRLQALQKNIDDRTQAIAGDYAVQLKLAIEHNKTQEEFDKIESDRTKALAELTANVQKEIYDITLSWGEKRLKAIQDQDKEQNSVNDVSAKYNAESDALDKSLSLNLISVLIYNEKRKKLDEQYAIDKADAQVKDDQRELQALKDYQEKYLGVQAAFAKGQLEIAQASGDPDKIGRAQAEVDAITKVQGEGAALIAALFKKSNEDQDIDNKAHNAKTVKGAAELKNNLTQLAQKTEEFATSLVHDSYQKREESIERITELQDAASDEEIAAVQRSTLSTRQQAEEETILAAQKTARDTAAKKQERADKVAEAKFDRDYAVAQVVWNIGLAIVKTLSTYGFTPLGIAAAAAMAALGVVEIAEIESKPLPSYAEGVGIPGRGRHPGGEAIVGEKGPELVSEPGRKPFVVDQATLIDLAPDSKVQPLNKGIISELSDIGMMRGFAILNGHHAQDNAVEKAINNQTARLERALKKSQRKIINQIVIPGEYAGLGRDYCETKILGKKR